MKNKANSKTYLANSRNAPLSMILIRAAAGNPRRGWLTAGGQTVPVALGRGGIAANKREGDGGTPRGIFHARKLWWRADRHTKPRTFLPLHAIRPEDAWCEDPNDRHYNRPIRLTHEAPGDRLTRKDHLYDFIVEIDHNTRPRVAGRGSAVFLHLAREGYPHTAGCVAMTEHDLRAALAQIQTGDKVLITG